MLENKHPGGEADSWFWHDPCVTDWSTGEELFSPRARWSRATEPLFSKCRVPNLRIVLVNQLLLSFSSCFPFPLSREVDELGFTVSSSRLFGFGTFASSSSSDLPWRSEWSCCRWSSFSCSDINGFEAGNLCRDICRSGIFSAEDVEATFGRCGWCADLIWDISWSCFAVIGTEDDWEAGDKKDPGLAGGAALSSSGIDFSLNFELLSCSLTLARWWYSSWLASDVCVKYAVVAMDNRYLLRLELLGSWRDFELKSGQLLSLTLLLTWRGNTPITTNYLSSQANLSQKS